VADDGTGIPADEREVLLGEREISQLHDNGGLGLWLVGWIANRYDGEFDIESGDGTTVVLRFDSAAEPWPGAHTVGCNFGKRVGTSWCRYPSREYSRQYQDWS
jgi:K+-sensing histidine kinase KdpD